MVATREVFPRHLKNMSSDLTTECHTELYYGYGEEVPETSVEQDHNMWNEVPNLIIQHHTGLFFKSRLRDEELGRVAISCHFAVDCLCAELYAF